MITDPYIVLTINTLNKLEQIEKSYSESSLKLYIFYYKAAKYQNTSKPWATVDFCAKGLGWSRRKVQMVRKHLKDAGLIKDIPATKVHKKTYIKLMQYVSENKRETIFKEHSAKFCTPTKKKNIKKQTPTKVGCKNLHQENKSEKDSVNRGAKSCAGVGCKVLRVNASICKNRNAVKINLNNFPSENHGQARDGNNLAGNKNNGSNGHNGSLTKKLAKITLNTFEGFNYSDSTKRILRVWKSLKGKVFKDTSAKGNDLVEHYTEELLLDGRNPYIRLISDEDHELGVKKWTEEEIKDCIRFYAGPKGLRKDISNMYFHEFIIFTSRKRNIPDYSPLIDAFKLIPKSTETCEKLKRKLSQKIEKENLSLDLNSASEISFQKAANYLDEISQKYESNPTNLRSSVMSVFVNYVIEKANNLNWKLNYIAGEEFKKEFLEVSLSRYSLYKIKPVRKTSSENLYA